MLTIIALMHLTQIIRLPHHDGLVYTIYSRQYIYSFGEEEEVEWWDAFAESYSSPFLCLRRRKMLKLSCSSLYLM